MPEITLKQEETQAAAETLGKLLRMHNPTAENAAVGRKLRYAFAAYNGAFQIFHEQVADAQSAHTARDPEGRLIPAVDEQGRQRQGQYAITDPLALRAALRAIGQLPVTITVPELITEEEWNGLSKAATEYLPAAPGEVPKSITLRRTEADRFALGALVQEATTPITIGEES